MCVIIDTLVEVGNNKFSVHRLMDNVLNVDCMMKISLGLIENIKSVSHVQCITCYISVIYSVLCKNYVSVELK